LQIVSGRERKLELKNKEEDLKKGLMQHMKQEVDNRDPRTVTSIMTNFLLRLLLDFDGGERSRKSSQGCKEIYWRYDD